MITPDFGPRVQTKATRRGNIVTLNRSPLQRAQASIRRTLTLLEQGRADLAHAETLNAAREFHPITQTLGCHFKHFEKLQGACRYTATFGDMSGRHLKAAREAVDAILEAAK